MAFKVSNNWNIGSVQLIQSMHSFKGRKKTDINVKKKTTENTISSRHHNVIETAESHLWFV